MDASCDDRSSLSLLFRPQVDAGAGPRAFIRRLADENAVTVRFLDKRGVRFDVEHLRRLGCLAAANEGEAADEYVRAASDSIARFPSAWLHRYSRYCPLCLGQGSAWPWRWEILFADACPLHRTWLIDRCACGRMLDWQRPALDECRCGRPIREAEASGCPAAVANLSSHLANVSLDLAGRSAPAVVHGLNLGQLTRVVRLLGCYGVLPLDPKPQKRTGLDRMHLSWPVSSAAAEIIEGWPDAFHILLERCQAAVRDTDREGQMPGVYGGLYRCMYVGGSPEFAPLRAEFERHIARRWRGALGQRNRRMANNVRDSMAWTPLSRAAQRLRARPAKAVTALACAGAQVERRTTRGGRTYTVVEKDGVERLIAGGTHTIPLKEAAKRLGLSRRRTRLLAVSRQLPAMRDGGFGAPWAVDQSELDAQLGSIRSAPVYSRPPKGAVALGRLLRGRACRDGAVLALIAAVLAGRVMLAGRLAGATGVASALMWAADVERHRRAQVSPSNDGRMTIPDLARHLSIKQEVAYHLVRSGRIEASDEVLAGGRHRAFVRSEAIAAFRDRFVLCRELAGQHGTSSRAVAKRLTACGIEPVAGPQVDGCRQLVYERTGRLEATVAAQVDAPGRPPRDSRVPCKGGVR